METLTIHTDSKTAMKVSWLIVVWFSLCTLCTAREVQLTILHTADLRGQVSPISDSPREDGAGGLLRCSTLIGGLRKHTPNSILIDCGNAFVGTPESHVTGGAMVRACLQSLKYDAWVVGDRDMDWGAKALARICKKSGVPALSANFRPRVGRPNPFPEVKPYIIKNVSGLKVAIVGLSSPAISLRQCRDMMGDAEFMSSTEALKTMMRTVRQQDPDIMILAANQSLLLYDDAGNEINEIARLFSEFDLILGGQTGETTASRMLKDTLFTQAGCSGLTVGQVDLIYDTVTRSVTHRAATLHDVDSTVAIDEDLREKLRVGLQRADVHARTRVGELTTNRPAYPDRSGSPSLQELVCEALRTKTRADIVLHAMLTKRSVKAGTLTRKDLWKIVPYESRLVTVEMTIKELDTVLEENARYADTPLFMGLIGASYDLSPRAPRNERVNNLQLGDGSVPHPRKRLRVAIDTFLLASGGGRFTRLREIAAKPNARLKVTEIDTRDTVAEYILKYSPL